MQEEMGRRMCWVEEMTLNCSESWGVDGCLSGDGFACVWAICSLREVFLYLSWSLLLLIPALPSGPCWINPAWHILKTFVVSWWWFALGCLSFFSLLGRIPQFVGLSGKLGVRKSSFLFPHGIWNVHPRAYTPQEKPPQWEAHILWLESSKYTLHN